MNKLQEDKDMHNQSQKNLDNILEITRLPTTINTLIHKNDSTMAMKLIKHFSENIYNDRSELLIEVKKEIDILEQKIQQKLNIELEEGKETSNEIELLLGENPTPEAIKEYIHKKYKIRKDLLKEKLQKILFSSLNHQESKKSLKIIE